MKKVALVFALCSSVTAQNTFVTPRVHTNQAGLWFASLLQPLPSETMREQLIYDVSDIAPPAALLRSLSWRRSNVLISAMPAATVTAQVFLSVGPNNAANASPIFSANHGPLPILAFSGTVQIPAQPNSGPGPAPFSIQVPFLAPFVYAAANGQSLVVDVITSNYTTTAAAQWGLDARGQGGGVSLNNGPTLLNAQCRFSNANGASL